ncbi:carboxyl transferase domain-containing protein [Sulfuracidifex tepidarius]|uniref:carboxyl transferase domain-containing protein n=1 Tax=Sulfuracidifex tepidarius TaxID=1294262 RepID=UPI000B0BEA54|nr:carboxyl transferase domain-containing protein [Sulfuracidifex tepidarius]
MDKLIEEMRNIKGKAMAGGGEDKIKAQHEKGKMTARERIALLFDEGTFSEVMTLAKTQSTEFGLDKTEYYGDGVVTGWGKIDGRTAFVYSQDFTSIGGTLGEMHASKIAKVYELALKVAHQS